MSFKALLIQKSPSSRPNGLIYSMQTNSVSSQKCIPGSLQDQRKTIEVFMRIQKTRQHVEKYHFLPGRVICQDPCTLGPRIISWWCSRGLTCYVALDKAARWRLTRLLVGAWRGCKGKYPQTLKIPVMGKILHLAAGALGIGGRYGTI